MSTGFTTFFDILLGAMEGPATPCGSEPRPKQNRQCPRTLRPARIPICGLTPRSSPHQGRGLGGEAAWGGDGTGGFVAPPEGLEKGLETRLRQWDYSIMKLVADDNGRLACKSLFTPKRAFSAERQADGSIRLVELVEKEVPVVRARKVNGRWVGAEVQLDSAEVVRAIRADREAR
jgi:hypothetical protein